MPIQFIPNDPLAVADLPIRSGVTPRPDRPAGTAGFEFRNPKPESEFAPGTPEFLFWQCREASLSTVAVWERLNGPLKAWSSAAPNPAKLVVEADVREELNAFYDRRGLRFFHKTTGNRTTFSGASTDVVSHECGHALLDAIQPELFDIHQTEFGAFHESFGDCMAIVVALSDAGCRTALLQKTADLGAPNFVEAVMEDLSDGVRRAFGAANPSAAPRRALNVFQFQLPDSLPRIAPPTKLSAEEHSFSRVFTGCFYDLIRGLFAASAGRTEADLEQASTTAAKLLIAGAKSAVKNSRFFQAVGRAMMLADAGANSPILAAAFAGHGILLGTPAPPMPQISLAGAAPRMAGRARTAVVDPKTSADLKRRLGAASSARLSFARHPLERNLVEAVHRRSIALDDLDPMLKGVVAIVPESIAIGGSGPRAAVFGAMPSVDSTEQEVLGFVKTLLASGRLAARRTAGRALAFSGASGGDPENATHEIATLQGKRVLQRIRFACGCASLNPPRR